MTIKNKTAATVNYDAIVRGYADGFIQATFADAVDYAAGQNRDSEHDDPVLLERTPWRGGDNISDFCPEPTAKAISLAEQMLGKMKSNREGIADGAAGVEQDFLAYKEESGNDEEHYGYYLSMQHQGHGVGLYDDGYDTAFDKFYFETYGFVVLEGTQIKFDLTVGNAQLEFDVTDELGHYLVEDTKEASAKKVACAKCGLPKKAATQRQAGPGAAFEFLFVDTKRWVGKTPDVDSSGVVDLDVNAMMKALRSNGSFTVKVDPLWVNNLYVASYYNLASARDAGTIDAVEIVVDKFDRDNLDYALKEKFSQSIDTVELVSATVEFDSFHSNCVRGGGYTVPSAPDTIDVETTYNAVLTFCEAEDADIEFTVNMQLESCLAIMTLSDSMKVAVDSLYEFSEDPDEDLDRHF